jgi:hypothetical protein
MGSVTSVVLMTPFVLSVHLLIHPPTVRAAEPA